MNLKAIIARSLLIACFLFLCVVAPAVNQAASDDFYSILKGDDPVFNLWLDRDNAKLDPLSAEQEKDELKAALEQEARAKKFWAKEEALASKGDVMDMVNRDSAKLDQLAAKQEKDEFKAALEQEARTKKIWARIEALASTGDVMDTRQCKTCGQKDASSSYGGNVVNAQGCSDPFWSPQGSECFRFDQAYNYVHSLSFY